MYWVVVLFLARTVYSNSHNPDGKVFFYLMKQTPIPEKGNVKIVRAASQIYHDLIEIFNCWL